MHGVLRLIQNELSKIFHRISWKILTLLLLLLSVGAPILRYFASAGYDFSDYYIRVCPTAEAKAQFCPEGSIEKEYYLTLAEAYNYFVQQGFDKDSWQFDNAFDGYARSMDSLRGCQLYIEGGDIVEISDYFSIDEVDIYWDNNNTRHAVYHGYLIDRLNLRQTPQGESDSEQASRSAVRNTAAEETAVRLLMIRPVQGGKYCFQSCAACFFALRVG